MYQQNITKSREIQQAATAKHYIGERKCTQVRAQVVVCGWYEHHQKKHFARTKLAYDFNLQCEIAPTAVIVCLLSLSVRRVCCFILPLFVEYGNNILSLRLQHRHTK